LKITLKIQDKVPASPSFSIDLTTIKGFPTTAFRYSEKTENTGDEELMVNLIADVKSGKWFGFYIPSLGLDKE
jgi:hypothetical protein